MNNKAIRLEEEEEEEDLERERELENDHLQDWYKNIAWKLDCIDPNVSAIFHSFSEY